MAERKYKLTFRMSDGLEQSVEIVVPQGEPGYTPRKGIDYFDGKSAYAYAVENGYEGTEEEFASMMAKAGNGSSGASFETDETLTLKNGVLSVNTANNAEEDNTLPITSAAVHTQIGNIEVLLQTI